MKLVCVSDISIVHECQLTFNSKYQVNSLHNEKTVLSVVSTVCDV